MALALIGTSGAGALSLLDLDAGASFASGDGSLSFQFDPGSIQLGGGLAADLSLYTVNVLAQGFSIVGPLAVADGGTGILLFDYEVSSLAGDILSASLDSQAVALGSTALALVAENVTGLGPLANAVTGGGLNQLSDMAAGNAGSAAAVETALTLVALGQGQLAAVTQLQQTFTVALPEPTTGLLLIAGLLGLAAMGTGERKTS